MTMIKKNSISELVMAVQMTIQATIKGTVANADPHFSIEYATLSDENWIEGNPKSNKINEVERVVSSFVETHQPDAIRVSVYSTPKNLHSRFAVKINESEYVPVYDKDTRKPALEVNEVDNNMQGLGMLGNLMLQNTATTYEGKINTLRMQYENEIAMLKLTEGNEKRELLRRIKDLEEQIEDCEEDIAELEELNAKLNQIVEEKQSEFSQVKQQAMSVGLAGLAGKFLGINPTDLAGIFGGNDGKQALPESENAAEFSVQPAGNENADAITAWLMKLPQNEMLMMISILQKFEQDREMISTVYEMIKN